MGKGFLIVEVTAAEGALPVPNAFVRIWTDDNKLLKQMSTNQDGNTEQVTLAAPDKQNQLSPQTAPNAYYNYTVEVRADGYVPIYIKGVQIVDESESVLPVALHPLACGSTHDCGYEFIDIPPPLCAEPTPPQLQSAEPQKGSMAFQLGVNENDYRYNPTWIKDNLDPGGNYVDIGNLPIDRNLEDDQYGQMGTIERVRQNIMSNQSLPTGLSPNFDGQNNSFLGSNNAKKNSEQPKADQWENKARMVGARSFVPEFSYIPQIYRDAQIPPYTQSVPAGGKILSQNQIAAAVQAHPLVPTPSSFAPTLNRDPAASLGPVFIPEFVRVKLGLPTSSAQVVRVPFIDYIKNVTSSEIFDSWPRNSMIANIHVIVTFVLNRVFAEWYPSRGHNFDITSTTQHDQRFIYGRNIFANISRTVDEFWNVYAHRIGFANPHFTEYCNGTTATCRGLSQWGTVTLANQGLNPLQILHRFYPTDLTLATASMAGSVVSSFPGTNLQIGSSGPNVLRIQNFLNRIRTNFPAIPLISNPTGIFGPETEAAVRGFQRTKNMTVNGIVGSATWNRITQIYTAVIRLSELDSEAIRVGLSPNPPTVVIRQGSRGVNVAHLQYILDVLSRFYANIPSIIRDSNFGPRTRDAVIAFQQMQGITADGIVGPVTWGRLYAAYRGAVGTHTQNPPPVPPTNPSNPNYRPYPGTLVREGARGEDVRWIQQSINIIRRVYPSLPWLSEDGVFGPLTRAAVVAFQNTFALSPDGIVGPITWAKLLQKRNEINGGAGGGGSGGGGSGGSGQNTQYPGFILQRGMRGDEVRFMQQMLRDISARNPQIPTITADGIFGPLTQNAVLAFQRLVGITADGLVGPITWGRLVSEWQRR